MAYTAHHLRLSRAIHVPGRGTKYLSDLEFRQVMQAWHGADGTQEDLAGALGMSKGGWHNNTETLVSIGVMTKLTRLGRHGHTHVRTRRGLRFLGWAVRLLGSLFVAYRVRPLSETTTTSSRSLSSVGSLMGDISARWPS
jgi:hypothetical protein